MIANEHPDIISNNMVANCKFLICVLILFTRVEYGIVFFISSPANNPFCDL